MITNEQLKEKLQEHNINTGKYAEVYLNISWDILFDILDKLNEKEK